MQTKPAKTIFYGIIYLYQLGKLRGDDPKLDRSKFRSKWEEL